MSRNIKLKKVNKSFLTEPKESRQVFRVFSHSYEYVYERFPYPYPYTYVHFTYLYLGRIFGPICITVLMISLHALKCFQILESNINNCICTQLNGFKHRDETLTIQYRHTGKEFQVLLINTNNSTQQYTFVSIQLNCSKYFNETLTIRVNVSHLFIHSLNAQISI